MASESESFNDQPTNRKQTFIFPQPKIYFVLEEVEETTVGELKERLQNSITEFNEKMCPKFGYLTIFYEVKGDDGVGVVLSGPNFDKDATLPTSADGMFHISARPFEEEYPIFVSIPLDDPVPKGRTQDTFMVKWTDDVHSLKKLIKGRYGYPMSSQKLVLPGDRHQLCDNARLGDQRIVRRLYNRSPPYDANHH